MTQSNCNHAGQLFCINFDFQIFRTDFKTEASTGAFYLTCFQYMYFNSAPWYIHEKIQRDAVSPLINGNAVSH